MAALKQGCYFCTWTWGHYQNQTQCPMSVTHHVVDPYQSPSDSHNDICSISFGVVGSTVSQLDSCAFEVITVGLEVSVFYLCY
jgi:hypothetical protein